MIDQLLHVNHFFCLSFVGVSKRQVSVSELAEILNNLKARNVDNNVKLQSLRFGRK